MEFTFYTADKIVFKRGALKEAGDYIARLGNEVPGHYRTHSLRRVRQWRDLTETAAGEALGSRHSSDL
ncbi:MAG: hypothetical protein ACLTT1_04670 [[Clostridium] scindens]